jgi:uncharacterized protein YmfQ (DUF2313 family)
MNIERPAPGAIYELTVSVPAGTYTPNEEFSTLGWFFTHVSGNFYPIDSTVAVDATGAASLRVTPTLFGEPVVTTASTLTQMPDGETYDVDEVEPSPYTEYARQLADLLGTAYIPKDGSFVAEDLRALGRGLSGASDIIDDAINQAFPNTATSMLADWEARLGVPIDTTLSDEQRQANLLGKWRTRIGGSPQRIERAIRSIDPTATVLEFTIEQVYDNEPNATLWGSQTYRLVFRFAVQLSAATVADASKLSRIRAIVSQMKPAHTEFDTTVETSFRWDDPDSLFDRDIWGQ